MQKPLEVVVICMTGVMCEAIADAIECKSITVTGMRSSASRTNDDLLIGKTIVYAWGGGDETFAESEAALLSACNAQSWIILSNDTNNAIVERLMADGRAVSTAPLDIRSDDLRHLICLAERNSTVCVRAACDVANAAAGQFLRRANLDSDQITLLQYLSNGLSNKEIARAWDCTEGSVKVHIRQLMLKLGVSNRTQAAVLAVRAGLSPPASSAEAVSAFPQPPVSSASSRFQEHSFSALPTSQQQAYDPPTLLRSQRGYQNRLAS